MTPRAPICWCWCCWRRENGKPALPAKKKGGERVCVGTRRNAALSRHDSEHALARLTRVRKFVVNLKQGLRNISRKKGKCACENIRNKIRKLCGHRQCTCMHFLKLLNSLYSIFSNVVTRNSVTYQSVLPWGPHGKRGVPLPPSRGNGKGGVGGS